MGVDENKVVEDLSNELKNLKKDNEDYKQRVFSLDRELWRLKDESNTWKNLPWHKRLFVK
jgi:predicted RNase H-like nuclease (RuvC/YqgF family)